MKEPHGKGLATRPGPESCAGHGNMTGEALTFGLWPDGGHARFQGVGRSHSTREAGEQSRSAGGGVRGGKGTDQGERPTDLTRAGHSAGKAWHRMVGRTRGSEAGYTHIPTSD